MTTQYGSYPAPAHNFEMTDPPHSATKLFPSSGYRPIDEPANQFYVRQQRDSHLKRNIRIFKLLARILSLMLAIYATYSQIITLHKYLSTRGIIIDGRNAWAKQTTLWPTIVLLSTSAATLLIDFIVIASYFVSIYYANVTSNTIGTFAIIAELAAHLSVWIGASIAYKLGETGHDLWGWTCSDNSDSIQTQFEAVVNFNDYCNIQTYAWYISIAQAGLAILILAVYLLTWRRLSNQKKMKQHASQFNF